MEYNQNQNYQNTPNGNEQPVFLKEKSHNTKIWYWLLALLILILLGWYAYSAGWLNRFIGSSSSQGGDIMLENQNKQTETQEQKQQEASISNLTIQTSNGFPVEKTLVVKGQLAGCTHLNEPQVIQDGNVFYVNLTVSQDNNGGQACAEEIQNYEQRINLPVNGLPAGVYTIVINGKQLTFELEQDNKIDFSVGGEK